MRIRLANARDAAAIAPLMWQAMPEVVAHWLGDDDRAAGIDFLGFWIARPDNLYSFQNTLVLEDANGIAASLTGYDGARQASLRAPLLAARRGVMLEAETQAGEWYVDTVSVAADRQGQGLGGQMLRAFADHARGQGATRVGLLVDVNKAAAQRLYTRLGFVVQGQKPLSGGFYHHMVLALR